MCLRASLAPMALGALQVDLLSARTSASMSRKQIASLSKCHRVSLY